MEEGTNILSASELMHIFLSNTSENDVKYIRGLNPFTIKVDGEQMFIYIKNLTPAQLSNNNPDIWRIQLPLRVEFENIKYSDSLFVLIGYDKDNDVYTTWNPYWCKQRLNVGKSVSLYSRLSLQKRVHEFGVIEKLPLNNDGDVICIPGNRIYEYLKNIKTYYPEETIFIAKNSSLKNKPLITKTPEELYNDFININANIEDYSKYLLSLGRRKKTVNNYLNSLKYVVEKNLLEKYSYLFLGCRNYSQYEEPLKKFIKTDDVQEKDVPWNGHIRAAMNNYLDFWLNKLNTETKQPSLIECENKDTVIETAKDKYYELDEFGKIVALDEELFQLLMPYTNEDYPDYELMVRIAENFYSPEITDKMNPFDWINLFENLKKVKKGKVKNKKNQEKKQQLSALTKNKGKTSRKDTLLRVEMPDGKVIQYPSATNTFVEIIENNYPDLIEEIDFGFAVISRERFPDFKSTKRSQRQLSNGHYLSTHFTTDTKAKILEKITEELELGLKIIVIGKEL